MLHGLADVVAIAAAALAGMGRALLVSHQRANSVAGPELAVSNPVEADREVASLASAAMGYAIESASIIRRIGIENGGKPAAAVWFSGARLPLAVSRCDNAGCHAVTGPDHGPELPAGWTPEHVGARMIEGFESLLALSGRVGPKQYGGSWPAVLHEFADLVDEDAMKHAREAFVRDRRRPRMARLGQTMLDVEIGAGRLEGLAAEGHPLGAHGLDLRRRPGVAGRLGEVGAVVGEHSVDLVGDGGGKSFEEVAGNPAGGLLVQLGEANLEVRSIATRR